MRIKYNIILILLKHYKLLQKLSTCSKKKRKSKTTFSHYHSPHQPPNDTIAVSCENRQPKKRKLYRGSLAAHRVISSTSKQGALIALGADKKEKGERETQKAAARSQGWQQWIQLLLANFHGDNVASSRALCWMSNNAAERQERQEGSKREKELSILKTKAAYTCRRRRR